MALGPVDPTAPVALPKRRRRTTSYRTNLVTKSNEQQLELQWTEVNVHAPEVLDVVEEHTPEEMPVAEAAVTLGPQDVNRRAYPLAYDPEGPAGPALSLLGEVRDLAASIVDAYSDSDMATVGSRLAMSAALLSKAYPHTAFNPALGAVVSFLRRATLIADVTQCGLEELMALAKAARHLAENPLISLDDSAELVIELEGQGWAGADSDIAKFVSAVFGDLDEAASTQPQMPTDIEGIVE
ncbi:MAG: hypothetical protein ACKVQA_00365 [Burkholderiales bacterium]